MFVRSWPNTSGVRAWPDNFINGTVILVGIARSQLYYRDPVQMFL